MVVDCRESLYDTAPRLLQYEGRPMVSPPTSHPLIINLYL